MRKDLEEIWAAGLAAADPERAVERVLALEDGAIVVEGECFTPKRVFVVAAGKAAGTMANAARELLGDKVSGGLVVTKDPRRWSWGLQDRFPPPIQSPTRGGVEAARKYRSLLGIWGGGSASRP